MTWKNNDNASEEEMKTHNTGEIVATQQAFLDLAEEHKNDKNNKPINNWLWFQVKLVPLTTSGRSVN